MFQQLLKIFMCKFRYFLIENIHKKDANLREISKLHTFFELNTTIVQILAEILALSPLVLYTYILILKEFLQKK